MIIFLYFIWKIYSWFKFPSHRPLFTRARDINIYEGMRESQLEYINAGQVDEEGRRKSIADLQQERHKNWYDYPKSVVTGLF